LLASAAVAGYLVAISPPAALASRRRLFAVLEAALPVRFEAREIGAWDGAAAAVLFETEPPSDSRIPTFSALFSESEVPGEPRLVDFGVAQVDRRLQGQSLAERYGPREKMMGGEGATVLAAAGADPVWLVRGRAHLATATPAELAPGEPLRERLRGGRFLALLPLLHFLRTVSADAGWAAPPLRASFILDDPNLHRPSYGHVRYDELRRAAENRFHVAIAMVPLDGWFAHQATARLFREHSQHLSILVHGNDHIARELARPADDEEALRVAAQALRRIEAFEQRTRVSVARLMTPPHGRCSEPSMRALLRTGFEAACVSRPYPWLDRPPADRPLAGWGPADFVAGGFPVLPRYPLGGPWDEVVLRAFLDQPLIPYGHHDDLAPGPEAIADAAAGIERLGEVQWLPPGEIARSNVALRQEGNELHVLLFARRARLTIPEGIERVVPHLPGSHDEPRAEIGLEPQPVRGPGTVEIELVRRDAVDPASVDDRPWRPWPLARRFLTEGRDRIQPLVSRARRTQPRARA
jgi:hypothetical protein